MIADLNFVNVIIIIKFQKMPQLLILIQNRTTFTAYETRLIGWILGNATGYSGDDLLACIDIAMRSPFVSTEIDG